jgi:DNA-binding NarL/FixJ family response regulator
VTATLTPAHQSTVKPTPVPSHGAIARTLVVSEAAVGKHIGNIPTKLDLPPTDEGHRRVLAVLAFLRA